MHVTGGWSLAGAIVTGLIIADILYRGQASGNLLRIGGNVTSSESRLLAGRRG
jgi:hypothetical protein